jgi:hypothetical protein
MESYERKTTFDELFDDEPAAGNFIEGQVVEVNSDDSYKFSKKIVIFSMVTVLIFFTVAMYFVWHGRVVPDEIVRQFSRIFGIELSALAGIKIAEVVGDYLKSRNNNYG